MTRLLDGRGAKRRPLIPYCRTGLDRIAGRLCVHNGRTTKGKESAHALSTLNV